ncbi:glycosyltransferase [Patescibacteria group bacterium]|nr:glycosyltransferase [Patescibacteria group bacterium]
MNKSTIVIPAYNEGERIKPTLDGYCKYFKDEADILVVVNGCTDNTEEVVKNLAGKYSNLKYLVTNDPGKGGAVYHGFKKAETEYIGFVDADMATTPQEYDKLIKAMDGNDGVIASRYGKGAKITKRSFLRRLSSWVFRVVVKVVFWMPYTDTQCGAKIFSKKLITALMPKLNITNMTFDVDLLFKAKKAGFKVIEIPTIWIEKGSSAALGSPGKLLKSSINMFATLFKIRFYG